MSCFELAIMENFQFNYKKILIHMSSKEKKKGKNLDEVVYLAVFGTPK